MKIAIPVHSNKLCQHFGHCEQFYICIAEEDNKKIISSELIIPPPHEPGLLPRWLGEKSVDVIITGGMGQKAQALFEERNIKVFTGAPSLPPDALVEQYLIGNLEYGSNACDH